MHRDLTTLPATVDSISLEPLERGGRATTLVRVTGAGDIGLGEDVTHDTADRAHFRGLDLRSLRGQLVVGEAVAALDLSKGLTHRVVASYRRWAIESALVDLALRQQGLAFAEALGLAPRPVNFVVSPAGGDVEALRGLLARGPGLRLKLDPRSSWPRAQIDELAALGAVDVLDLKGTYPGTAVYQPPDERLYRDLVEAFPNAWFEDPAPELVDLIPGRVAWDEPLHEPDDLDTLEPVAGANLKPSRLGGLTALLETVDRCRDSGLALYCGGQSEIGPGRGQVQLLAALLSPDGPNDVAPVGYDDIGSTARLEPPPLRPASRVGFR